MLATSVQLRIFTGVRSSSFDSTGLTYATFRHDTPKILSFIKETLHFWKRQYPRVACIKLIGKKVAHLASIAHLLFWYRPLYSWPIRMRLFTFRGWINHQCPQVDSEEIGLSVSLYRKHQSSIRYFGLHASAKRIIGAVRNWVLVVQTFVSLKPVPQNSEVVVVYASFFFRSN